MADSTAAGSFIDAFIMTSVLSAGNHALFAETILRYTLAVDRHAPLSFPTLNRNQIPSIAVQATPAILGMYVGWKVLKRTEVVGLTGMDLGADTYSLEREDLGVSGETREGVEVEGKGGDVWSMDHIGIFGGADITCACSVLHPMNGHEMVSILGSFSRAGYSHGL